MIAVFAGPGPVRAGPSLFPRIPLPTGRIWANTSDEHMPLNEIFVNLELGDDVSSSVNGDLACWTFGVVFEEVLCLLFTSS